MDSARVKVSKISGKFCSVVGYTLGSLLTLALIINISDGKSSETPIGTNIIMFSIFFALSGFLIYKGITIKRRIKQFKNYVHLISYSNITSIQSIAASNNQSIDFITKDIQKMIDKGYFKNAVIDTKLGEIIIGKIPTYQPSPLNVVTAETKNVKCKSCGALNTVIVGKTANCEYCGSPIEEE